MAQRVVAWVATAGFVLLLVSCGVANLLHTGPAVWPAYQDGYAAGQAYGSDRDQGKTAERCEIRGHEKYEGAAAWAMGIAFTAGCNDGAAAVPMQSEAAVQDQYGDVPAGD